MKKILIIIFCFLLIGCKEKEVSELTVIKLNDNLNIEYGDIVELYDLVNIENGNIVTENYELDTMTLGKRNIKFKYKDKNNNKFDYNFDIVIVDTTAPLIMARNVYYIELNNDIDLIDLPICVDNYDKGIKCNIEGIYDNTKVGEYSMKFTSTDSNGNTNEKSFNLIVEESSDEDDYYETSPIYLTDAINKYKNNNTMIGIDVSSWQEDIDWEKIKNEGIEFAMVRIGFGHNNDGEIVLDSRYKENIKNAKKAGIKVGLYFYSYASNTNEALAQAKWILKTLDGEKLDLPIAFDWEDWNSFNDYSFNLIEFNNIAKIFMDTLEKKEYKVMNYGSALYLENIWNLGSYDTWLAHYTDETNYEGNYLIWQFTNSGIVEGINGYVDLNVLYKE